MEATGHKRFQDSGELWTNILSAGSKQTFLCLGEFWATRIFKPENQTQDTWIVCCIRTRSAAEISMPMQRRLRRGIFSTVVFRFAPPKSAPGGEHTGPPPTTW